MPRSGHFETKIHSINSNTVWSNTRLYSSKHIPQILIKSYITTYCSDVVRSLVPNVPEDLFDYMGSIGYASAN